MIDDDKDTMAAEYVLGTLGPDERAEAQALIAVDPGFAEIVAKWEKRLGELNALVAPVEPPPHLWEKVRTLVAGAGQSGDIALPAVALPPAPPKEAGGEPTAAVVAEAEAARMLRGRLTRSRAISAFLFLVGLGLAALIGLRELRPELLPASLRPTPVIQTVEVEKTVEVPSPRPAQFISVLQANAFEPTFLLTFDMDRKVFSVRALAAPKQPGKSYELWLTPAQQSTPQSLGVVGAQEFTIRPARPEWNSTALANATYSVSVEPQGGSPTGAPSGPMMFSGKLIQSTPPGFPVQTP